MSESESLENRLARLEKSHAEALQSLRVLEDIRAALLGNESWGRKGMVKEFEELSEKVHELLEFKARGAWLLISLLTIAGALGATFKWLLTEFFHK